MHHRRSDKRNMYVLRILTVLVSPFVACSFHREGSTYIRWGRRDCPSGSTMVYAGAVAGNHYTHRAGPANPLCLPDDPEYGEYTAKFDNHGDIHGAEYETFHQLKAFTHLHDHDVPCAVCKTTKRRKPLMIPAKKTCPSGWHQEYTGYLMSGRWNGASSEYICVDGKAEPLTGGHRNDNGFLLYLVEGLCGSLRCPPYKNFGELTCVVCSQK